MSFRKYLGEFLFERDDDEDHLYRALNGHVHLDAIQGSSFFPDFERTDDRIVVGGHALEVIRIHRFPFQIRIQETTRSNSLAMIRFLVDFTIDCHRRGFTPSDIHEGNLLWWDRPYFVDFDALKPLNHPNAALTFVRIGYLFYKYVFDRKLPGHEQFNFKALEREGGWMAEQTKRQDFTDPRLWEEFLRIVDTVRTPTARPTHWSAEYAASPQATQNIKFENVREMAPVARTLLDVGCNKGYTCHLLKDKYEYVVGFDNDAACIEQAQTKPGMNFARFGLEHLDQEQPLPIHTRFHADVVLALAVTHHLDRAGFSVGRVANTLSRLTKQTLLIEDIVHRDHYDAQFSSLGFELIERRTSQPSERSLSLWKRT